MRITYHVGPTYEQEITQRQAAEIVTWEILRESEALALEQARRYAFLKVANKLTTSRFGLGAVLVRVHRG